MAVADDLLANNERFAAQFHTGTALPVAPSKHLAIVACMDSRLDLFQVLGLGEGEAHIIRNAGGVVTDDVIRSLLVSQRLLGTTDIVLVHHTDCGLHRLSGEQFKRDIEAEVGIRPTFSIEAFDDPYADVRQSIGRIQVSPFLRHTREVRGFVYEVETGRLKEVEGPNGDR
jgi:carbonic anhydrase